MLKTLDINHFGIDTNKPFKLHYILDNKEKKKIAVSN